VFDQASAIADAFPSAFSVGLEANHAYLDFPRMLLARLILIFLLSLKEASVSIAKRRDCKIRKTRLIGIILITRQQTFTVDKSMAVIDAGSPRNRPGVMATKSELQTTSC